MKKVERKYVDWDKTGKNLKILRCDNINLRRYVCSYIRTKKGICDGLNCMECKYDMDQNISRSELSQLFHVTENVIANWEDGRSVPMVDDILFYAEICELNIDEILVLR